MTVSRALGAVYSGDNCIHPQSVFVRLTSRCNQKCGFCNIRGDEPFELDHAGAAAAVDAALKARPDAVVHFTGGEPTLRADLFRLVKHARSHGARRVFLQTNAMRLATPGYTDELLAAGATDLIVSLHTFDPARSDALTQVPGAFSHTRAGILRALELGFGVWLNFVFTVQNLDDGPATVQTIARAFPGVRGLILSTVQPHGLAREGGAAVVPKLAAAAAAIWNTIVACEQSRLSYHLSSCENPLCFIFAATGTVSPTEEIVGHLRRRLQENGCTDCRLAETMDKDKIKPPACRECEVASLCFGVWRAQVEIHGASEVRPLSVVAANSSARGTG